jgi:hypothetical protein
MTGGGITYITAVNNESQYNSHVVRSLCPLGPDDEFIPVYDKTDAGEAYNEGIAKAKNRFKCFLHQDVIVIDPVLLRNHILGVCGSPGVGMFGIMGSTDRLSCPWWVNQGAMVGSVIHSKGLIQGGPGGSCALLDGLLLATGEEVEFSEEYGSYHFYAHDICQQMLERGLKNHCASDGRKLVVHNCHSGYDQNLLDSMKIYCRKWGVPWPEQFVKDEYGEGGDDGGV